MQNYQLEGRSVTHTQNPGWIIDIRELIDSGSHEFTSSKIPASKRLQIIEAIGQEPVFSALRNVFIEKDRQFIEGQDGNFDITVLQELASKELA